MSHQLGLQRISPSARSPFRGVNSPKRTPGTPSYSSLTPNGNTRPKSSTKQQVVSALKDLVVETIAGSVIAVAKSPAGVRETIVGSAIAVVKSPSAVRLRQILVNRAYDHFKGTEVIQDVESPDHFLPSYYDDNLTPETPDLKEMPKSPFDLSRAPERKSKEYVSVNPQSPMPFFLVDAGSRFNRAMKKIEKVRKHKQN